MSHIPQALDFLFEDARYAFLTLDSSGLIAQADSWASATEAAHRITRLGITCQTRSTADGLRWYVHACL